MVEVERKIFLLTEDGVSWSPCTKRAPLTCRQEFVVGTGHERPNTLSFRYKLPQGLHDVNKFIAGRQVVPDTILEGPTRDNYELYFKTF